MPRELEKGTELLAYCKKPPPYGFFLPVATLVRQDGLHVFDHNAQIPDLGPSGNIFWPVETGEDLLGHFVLIQIEKNPTFFGRSDDHTKSWYQVCWGVAPKKIASRVVWEGVEAHLCPGDNWAVGLPARTP